MATPQLLNSITQQALTAAKLDTTLEISELNNPGGTINLDEKLNNLELLFDDVSLDSWLDDRIDLEGLKDGDNKSLYHQALFLTGLQNVGKLLKQSDELHYQSTALSTNNKTKNISYHDLIVQMSGIYTQAEAEYDRLFRMWDNMVVSLEQQSQDEVTLGPQLGTAQVLLKYMERRMNQLKMKLINYVSDLIMMHPRAGSSKYSSTSDVIFEGPSFEMGCRVGREGYVLVHSKPEVLKSVFKVLENLDGGRVTKCEEAYSPLYRQMVQLNQYFYKGVLIPLFKFRKSTSNEPDWIWHSNFQWSIKSMEDQLRIELSQEEDLSLPGTPDSHSGEPKNSLKEGDNARLIVLKNILSCFSKTMRFFVKHVLLGRPELCQIVKKDLISSEKGKKKKLGQIEAPVQILLLDLLQHVLPGNINDLKELRADFIDEVRSLRGFLLSNHLLDPVSDLATELVMYETKIELKYAEKRRKQILNEGKIILSQDYHNTTRTGGKPKRSVVTNPLLDDGEEDDFLLHESSISTVAESYLQLIRNVLDEAVQSEDTLKDFDNSRDRPCTPSMLYKAGRELFDLFRAVIPSTHRKSLITVPRCAAILHNDCVYFAFYLLTLGIEYRPKFKDSVLNKVFITVDHVPFFRELAERTMGEMVHIQKQELVQIMEDRVSDLGRSLESSDGGSYWSEVETAIQGAVHHVRNLSNILKPVLSAEIYNRVIGSVMDTVFGILLEQIFSALDISEPGCQFISVIFEQASECVNVFDYREKQAEVSCEFWNRFSAVGKFMTMCLADITHALSAGVFRSLTASELSGLIKACFAQSEKRESVLRALQ